MEKHNTYGIIRLCVFVCVRASLSFSLSLSGGFLRCALWREKVVGLHDNPSEKTSIHSLSNQNCRHNKQLKTHSNDVNINVLIVCVWLALAIASRLAYAFGTLNRCWIRSYWCCCWWWCCRCCCCCCLVIGGCSGGCLVIGGGCFVMFTIMMMMWLLLLLHDYSLVVIVVTILCE